MRAQNQACQWHNREIFFSVSHESDVGKYVKCVALLSCVLQENCHLFKTQIDCYHAGV